MVTQISLGTFSQVTVNGLTKNILSSAGGSGLDDASIINTLTTAKSQPATNDQTAITANGKISSALTQFQTLLTNFQNDAYALSNPPGFNNQSNNVFAAATATVGNGGNSYFSVTAQSGAAQQSYNISNITLATAASQSTGVFNVAAATSSVVSANPISGNSYQFAPGTFSLAQNLTFSNFTTAAAGSGAITATVNSVADLQVGQTVTISGASGTLDGITDSQINGTQTITAINTATNTITFSTAGSAATGNQSSAEGSAAVGVAQQTITLNEGDSLNTVANDFNALSAATGIAATVVQVGAGEYQLSFNATSTGAAASFNLANNTSVLSDPSGVLGNVGFTDQQDSGDIGVSDPNQVVASSTPLDIGNQFNPGSYDINGQTVTINEGDTLTDVANDFNSVAGTGVTAHIVQAGTDEYQLVLVNNPASTALSNITFGTAVAATTATAGTNSSFDLNGIAISRPTNAISDVVSGLTFNLLQATPNSTTNYPVTVSADTTAITTAITNYVNDYNKLQTFAAQQTQLTSTGTYASSAVLATNSTFRQIMANINSQVTAEVTGLTGSITDISGAGITLSTQAATSTTPQVNNVLSIDSTQLASALSTNFQGVENVFGTGFTTNDPNLTLYSINNTTTATAFTLTINPGANTFQGSINNGPPIDFTETALPNNGGYVLTGPAGTALSGVELIYAGTANATINVSITQGVATTAYNTANAATTANTGIIPTALTSIQTQNTTLQNDITQVNASVSQYKEQLIQQYAALESAIQSANTILQSINANEEAQLEAAQVS